jgi:uncharacterized membrane protein
VWGHDNGDTIHAFLLDDGEFTTIDPPGASGAVTIASGINDHRQIVGWYLDACGKTHGFLRDKKGVFTNIDHPDSPLGTAALDINNRGQIVGVYSDGETAHGFLLDKGVFTRIDPPGASFTEAVGINGRGQIVGFYLDAEGTIHGFLRDRGRGARRDKGVFTSIDLPGVLATAADDINIRGQIVGTYSEVSNTRPLNTPRAYLLDDGDSMPWVLITPRPVKSTTAASSSAPTSMPEDHNMVFCGTRGEPSPPSTSREPSRPQQWGSTTVARSWAATSMPEVRILFLSAGQRALHHHQRPRRRR